MSEDTLYFPIEIAHAIGLPANTINAMKNRGCPFFGKKTTIRWVREFVAKEAGAIPASPEMSAAGQDSTAHR